MCTLRVVCVGQVGRGDAHREKLITVGIIIKCKIFRSFIHVTGLILCIFLVWSPKSKMSCTYAFYFQDCSAPNITPGITNNLFKSLEEHGATDDLSSLGNGGETIPSTPEKQDKELAVACLVKIIHLIHYADLKNQHQVCNPAYIRL